MADAYVQILPDSTGKKVDVSEITRPDNVVIERQRLVVGDPSLTSGLAPVDAILGLYTHPANEVAITGLLSDIKNELQNLVRLMGGQPAT